MDLHIATISILLSKREKNAEKLNPLLSEYSKIIRVRTGYNLEPKCIEDCLGAIVLIVEGAEEQITELANKIDDLQEAKVEKVILI